MSLTVGQRERILNTLKERIGGDIRCPLCRSSTWMFSEGVAVIQTQETLGDSVVPDKGLPALTLVCRQCGNTQFLNIYALGLADLFAEAGGNLSERRTA